MSSMPSASAGQRARPPDRVPLYRFLGPRFWLLWVALALVRAINTLPLRAQMAIGRRLGALAHACSRRDRRIANINVALCLPELSELERTALVRSHFQALACAVFETGLVWWADDRRLRRLVTFEGVEHLQGALARGRGALMLTAHFTTLEM